MHWYDHMNWGWGWGGGTMMILWIVVLAAIVYFVARASQRGGAPSAPPDSAIDILRKRYARGEISKEEFEERKRDLA